MAGDTVIRTSDELAVKAFSVSLQAEVERHSVFSRMMTGKQSTESMANAKRARQQSSPDMPIVAITDLQQGAGDRVSCDMFHIVSGEPFMGDQVMEGRGVPLTFTSMEVVINQTRFPIQGGSRMTQKRTKHDLRKQARAQMSSYFARLNDQIIQTHLAGARGTENTRDWNVPLEGSTNFNNIMINPVESPTTNRYYAAGGGDDPTDVTSADPLGLEDLDVIVADLRSQPFPPAPIKVQDDSMGDEFPIWCLMVSEWQWHYLLREFGEQTWRKSLADAALRGRATNHPLFTGEAGLWNGLLIKRMPRAIRFNTGSTIKLTNATSGAESSYTNTVTIDRAILLGGQALALARGSASGGSGMSAFPMRWSEVLMDHDNSIEIGAHMMDGKKKFRYTGSDGALTDFGVAVIDSYAPDPKSTAGQTLRDAID